MQWQGRRLPQIMCLAVFLLSGLAAEASAQWYTDGVEWHHYPGTGWAMPGKCLGNCGVDCGTRREPPGGCGKSDRGYWTMDVIWGPNYVRTLQPGEASQEFQPITLYDEYYGGCWGYDYEYLYDLYEGAARWTYHGIYSNFCADHDHACRKGGFFNGVYCYFPVDAARACVGVHYQTWSYDRYMTGEKNGYRHFLDWRIGPC